MDDKDTICAISSGLTESGIGVIRVSGDRAVPIVSSVFSEDLTSVPSHTVHYGHIIWEGERIDEVLCLVMRSPKTYTREDVVEVDCHGGVQVLHDVLSVLISAGARPARPGEFTERAFLNGRIDLSRATAVMDLIRAKSAYARRSALYQAEGALSDEVRDLRDKILHEAAFIEAALDDPENYDLNGYPKELRAKLSKMVSFMEERIALSGQGRVLTEGIRTAIIGSPNVGKSSLLNALSGRDRAIVTDVPGTTRDLLEEKVLVGDLTLVLTDTAGIRETEDEVERIGVARSLSELKSCDLLLFVLDSSRPLGKEDKKIFSSLPKDIPVILIINKSDLETDASFFLPDEVKDFPTVYISAKEKRGLDDLKKVLQHLFLSGGLPDPSEGMLSDARQVDEYKKAVSSLELVIKSIDDGMSEDFYSSDLMDAYRHLGAIIGEGVSDDLIDRIFSEFCMGK